MSSVNSVGGQSSVPTYSTSVKPSVTGNVGSSIVATGDRVEISGASRYLDLLKANDVRTDKVASVKSSIEDGSYDRDDSHLNAALDRLLDDVLA